MSLLRRAWKLVVERVLGLEDTPHRIAWGVFLGFVVAFSPTVGVQMVLYVMVATVFRANRVSGLPVVWVSNPITMLPIYVMNWRIGAWALGRPVDQARADAIIEGMMGGVGWSFARLLETSFWVELGATLWSIGGELWLGGLIVGVVLGLPFYPLTRWGVVAYRRARAKRSLERLAQVARENGEDGDGDGHKKNAIQRLQEAASEAATRARTRTASLAPTDPQP